MKTVLFGGAFDPPHRGHERALCAVIKRFAPDRVVILPSGRAPHKALSGGADDAGRMAMCRAAFAKYEEVTFSDFDLVQEGKCYTVLTLRHFREEDPDGQIILFVGTDQFLAFETWKNPAEILSNATLCVMSRDGDQEALASQKKYLEEKYRVEILSLSDEPVAVSSTGARREIASLGFSESLSPAVNEIIARRGFYGSRLNQERGGVLDRIEQDLDEERLSHTLSVERETVRLCRLLGRDERRLRLAALLHDLTRRWPAERQIMFLKEAGEEVSPEDKASPAVLHGRSGAIIAARDFSLPDLFCDAIRYHTTGRKKMTIEDKILFFADFIEETRTHAACRTARNAFYSDMPSDVSERMIRLNAFVLSALKGTVSHLTEKKLPVHPLTLQALDGLENESKRKEKI